MESGDPDPTCPHCGEPIGARATYCMHCGRDIVTDGDADASEADDYDTGLTAAAAVPGGSATESDRVAESDPATRGDASATGGSAAATGEDRGWFHPDSLLDDSLTVVVAVVAGLAIGFVSLFALVFPLGGVGALLAFVIWVGSTAYLARRRTVFGAVRYGAYGFAVALLVLPVGMLLGTSGDLGSRLGALVVFEFTVGVFALVVAGLGYVVGAFADDGTDPGL